LKKRSKTGIHSLTYASEVAALVVRDSDEANAQHDLIVEFKDMGP
jgi:hypothetical protein